MSTKPAAAKARAKAEPSSKPEGIYEAASRMRDVMMTGLKVGDVSAEFPKACSRMEEYLHDIGKRCTVERRFVLQMLYSLDRPVDSATLHQLVCSRLGNVAVPTVYSTLELLVQLRLARRFELFRHGTAFFERTLGIEAHGYAVCDHCGAIKLLPQPQMLQQMRLEVPPSFQVEDFTLVVHGCCWKCRKKRRKTSD